MQKQWRRQAMSKATIVDLVVGLDRAELMEIMNLEPD